MIQGVPRRMNYFILPITFDIIQIQIQSFTITVAYILANGWEFFFHLIVTIENIVEHLIYSKGLFTASAHT